MRHPAPTSSTIRCLRASQIAGEAEEPGCWYCPSCLCRGCFRTRADEEITQVRRCVRPTNVHDAPRRTCVPKGYWYCPLCSVQSGRGRMQRYEVNPE
ncbi:hypothetical protein ZWY2020_010476 [Hordeum vulgare]|nr:hypothetical protein ZWY2020_010476 [Hordeum vulgare]